VGSTDIDDPNGSVRDEIDAFSTLVQVAEVTGLVE